MTDELLAHAELWLAANVPPGRGLVNADYGTDARALAAAKAFQRAYFDAGLVGALVPTRFGGLELDHQQAFELAELAAAANLPDRRLFVIGLGMVVSTLLAHGTEEQKARYVPSILRGDEIWCQLFSEPGAGSDLAGVTTRAVADADGSWRVTGQKVWTSHGRVADFGILLARTGTTDRKHDNLTMFIAPMDAPGMVVRPLRQITGEAEFNEVFLDDVNLPADAVIGQVGGGWTVALTTLTSERQSLSTGTRTVSVDSVRDLLASVGDVAKLPVTLRETLVAQDIRANAFDALGGVIHEWARERRDPGVFGSVTKILSSGLTKKSAELALAVDGYRDVPDTATRQDALLRSRASSIAGGTDNIQRNIIAERILGLPKG